MNLVKTLDQVFSEFVRLRDADENGYISCCYCGGPIYWRSANNCHFVRRGNMATRWDESNCNGGHLQCNKEDDKIKYKTFIAFTYGVAKIVELENLGRSEVKFTESDLKSKIAYFRAKVKELKKVKNCERLF